MGLLKSPVSGGPCGCERHCARTARQQSGPDKRLHQLAVGDEPQRGTRPVSALKTESKSIKSQEITVVEKQ